jgi:hypothetical protein
VFLLDLFDNSCGFYPGFKRALLKRALVINVQQSAEYEVPDEPRELKCFAKLVRGLHVVSRAEINRPVLVRGRRGCGLEKL